jgi:diaminopimelate epimerase
LPVWDPEVRQPPIGVALTTDKCMTVIMPAGSVEIELKEDDMITITGPAKTCYAGYLPVIG